MSAKPFCTSGLLEISLVCPLTQIAILGSGIDKYSLERSIYDVLVHRAPVNLVTRHTGESGFDVLPANGDLTAAEVELLELENQIQFWRYSLS